MTQLKVGDPAPDFELTSDRGTPIRLSSFRGKSNVILYFYPRDGTSVCTAEACSFRDHHPAIASKDAEVLGVSVDSVDSHQRWSQELGLNFPLLSDTDGAVSKLYGVLGTFRDGKPASQRVTFLIDSGGIIKEVQELWDLKTPIAPLLDSHTQSVRDHVPALAQQL
jgi:thioredoxin-dependent peroxiredoxin